MIDPEYEKYYLTRIAELATGYEKKIADLLIENGHLKHALDMSEKMRTTPEEIEPLDGVGTMESRR